MEKFESVATLIGEPVRARMLWSLLDGRAYTATELSIYADVSAQNASMHLAKLVDAELLAVEKQGRHKYYRFARPEVAYAIEAMAGLLPDKKPTSVNHNSNEGIRFCRTCYDHLAGRVAVELARQMVSKKIIKPTDTQYAVTKDGEHWFNELGIDLMELQNQKRVFARQCLDWSERKHHIAGSLGAALLRMMVTKKWIMKRKDSRMAVLTPEGQFALHRELGLVI